MKLGVIIGATREGRTTDRAAAWVAKTAKKLDDVDVEIIDLRHFELPFFDEPMSPQYNAERITDGPVKEWLAKLAEKDALVVVTPEYNRSIPGVLKNALDYIAYELDRKPVGIVAHGATSGAQAVSHLRGIISGALGVSVPRAVFLPMSGTAFSEDGAIDEEIAANPYGPVGALDTMLNDLVAYSAALATIRQ